MIGTTQRALARNLGVALAAVVLCGFASSSLAGILHGNFSDIPPGTVMYLNVEETSFTDPIPPARYGVPTVTVNTMDFDPMLFEAGAAAGDSDLFDGQLNFSFMTTPNQGLPGLSIIESGLFSLLGTGTAATSVAAGIYIDVEITHVDGVQLTTPINVLRNTEFTTDLISSPGADLPWSNTLLVDFGPELALAGYAGKFATKGNVVINDTLGAISESNPDTSALIAKTDFKIVPTPEPTALGLMLLGLAGAGLRRRIL
jgi:hypothetical protein